jgi:hypothetical protein
MNDIKTTFRGLLLGVILLVIPIIVVGIFIAKNDLSYILGVLFGTIVAIGLLKHMQITVVKSVDKEPEAAKRYAIRNYLIRYFIMLSVLLIAIFRKEINVVGVFLALFTIKLSAYAHPYINRLNK